MEFEWDPAKAATNLGKHSTSFSEAATIFGDPCSVTFFDPEHSAEEDRFISIGMSIHAKVLIVSHTDRGDRIRIFSARRATRRERGIYGHG